MHQDPVCGMTIDQPQNTIQSEYQGETYYFCSTQCQQKFEQHPQHFAKRPTTQSAGGSPP